MTDQRVICPFDKGCLMTPLKDGLEEHRQRHHAPEASNDIQYWSDHLQALGQPQQRKAHKLIELQKIEYSGNGVYVALPIEGYNKTVHAMRKDDQGEFKCSCQGCNRNGSCSHIAALYLFFSMKQRYQA